MNAGLGPISAAPPARAAPSAAPANEAETGESGFAAALEDAQSPVKPKAAASNAAKPRPGAPAKAPQPPEAKAGEAGPAPLDAASPSTSVTATEPAPAQIKAAASDDAAAPDLSLLLPGWPETTALRRAEARSTALDDGKDRRARPGAGVEPLQRDRTELTQGVTELRLTAAGLPASAKPGPTTNTTAASTEAVASTARAGAEAASALPLPLLHTSAMPTTTATMAAAATAASAMPTFEAQLAAALDSPDFAPALATQVSWLVREGVQHARLSLNPAEMGPLMVQIAVDGTQARVDFSAEFAATRAAIESSLPTLAAALHDRGLTLAGGGVFDGQPRPGAQGDRGQPAPASARSGSPNDAAADTAASSRAQRPMQRGLVDLVA